MASSAPARGWAALHQLELLAAWKRLSIGLLPAGLLYILVPASWPLLLRLTASWDVFALTTLLITWGIILTADVGHIRRIATREDPGRVLSFGFVLAASSASLLAIVTLLASTRLSGQGGQLWPAVVGIGGVLAAWLLVHTLFTLRYAHLFYDTDNGRKEGGLEFPGAEKEPDYLDFAYYSFTIGMAAQTADVGVSGRTLRRLTLLHALLSFGFNTAIVALTVSSLAMLL